MNPRRLQAWADTARGALLANPAGLAERLRELSGGHAADPSHAPHLAEALAWLVRAQDATPDAGISRAYALIWNPYFRARGWQPSYPETTGYIIPTLYQAADRLDRPDLAARATRAAEWEAHLQLESGAVLGGVLGQARAPAVFNTGQVLLGWLAAWERTGETTFRDAALRAARYLADTQDADGHWRDDNSHYARSGATLYNARVAWALAVAGTMFEEPDLGRAAARNLDAVVQHQAENGWFPHCCLSDPTRPLLHTIAYTTRGLLEGGQVLGREAFIAAAVRTAAAVRARVHPDGFIAGRFNADWTPEVEWSCLTGNAQMANIWLRLAELTGEPQWLAPVGPVLTRLKRTQNRTSADPGLRGGIRGAWPVTGAYGRGEVLSWATKFFADALMRDDTRAGGPRPASAGFRLA